MTAAEHDIRLGLWKIHILHHAATRDVWGLWLLEELAEHGHKLSPGTLYPALARMERSGWLRRVDPEARERARHMFRITPEGQRLLASLKHDIQELYDEVILGHEHGHAPATAVSPNRGGSAAGKRRKKGAT